MRGTIKKSIGVAALLGLAVTLPILAAPPQMRWADDFRGFELDPRYTISTQGSGRYEIRDHPSSNLLLWATGTEFGSARLSLGDLDPYGNENCQWDPTRDLEFRARIFLNRNTQLGATLGLSAGDGRELLALVLDARDPRRPQWVLQARSAANGRNEGVSVPTNFIHRPGSWFDVTIQTRGGNRPQAIAYIDGQPRARIQWPNVPTQKMCPEFQIWNEETYGYEWSQPTMWIDWWGIRQGR